MEDVYFKKIVTYNFWKHSLQFKSSQDLFSSDDVDLGTQFLLRSIVEGKYAPPGSFLDLGCGYGPLGLTLKSLLPDCQVHLVDKDALALEYSRQNAELNRLPGVDIYGSLGYDSVRKSDFDLIVSNIPGKAGEPVIAYLLDEGRYRLAPAGIMAVVIVDPLETTVEKILSSVKGVEIIQKRTRPGHAVFHYRFIATPDTQTPPQTALERGIYTRNRMTFHFDDFTFPLQTTYGLPEFDTLDYRSELLTKALLSLKGQSVHRAALINPGQGHVAVATSRIFNPDHISLIGRDLLALEYSRLNLISNGYQPQNIEVRHQVGVDLHRADDVDIIAGVLREEEGQEALLQTLEQALSNLSAGGTVLVAGSSTAIARLGTRMQTEGRLHIKGRDKWRGYSLLALGRV
jgi:16S rRNA (guanine1207-N2)-methyltransferase